MSYDVVVSDDLARQGVAVRVFQRASNPVLLSQTTGVPRWDIVREGEETSPTFVLPREIAEQLARRLMDFFQMGREDTGEHRYRVAYLEGEQSGMRRHLDGLERLLRRVVTLVPEGPPVFPVSGQLASVALNAEVSIGDNDRDLGPEGLEILPGRVDYWRRRALDAEATIRDALGETVPLRPPRRILDIEPARDVSNAATTTVPGFAGEDA